MAPQDCKITLHWLNQSRAQTVLWLMEELGLEYSLKTYKRGKDMLAPPELKRVHPLGKSPVLELQPAGADKPLILAETGLIIEYLIEHFGPQLAPTHWQPGKENKVGGETEAWMRYKYYLNYIEGSLMPALVMVLVAVMIKTAPLPFFVRWLPALVGEQVYQQALPRAKEQFAFVESQLASAPDGGPYMCGNKLTGIDIMLCMPLQASAKQIGLKNYPKLSAYVEMLEKTDSYKRNVERVTQEFGKYEDMAF